MWVFSNQEAKKTILKLESIKCKDQIVRNTINNLHNVPCLNTLKIVFMVLQFSLLEEGNKNTLYFPKVMCSLWACSLCSYLLYTRFFFFHLSGSGFTSVYLSIPFLKSVCKRGVMQAHRNVNRLIFSRFSSKHSVSVTLPLFLIKYEYILIGKNGKLSFTIRSHICTVRRSYTKP